MAEQIFIGLFSALLLVEIVLTYNAWHLACAVRSPTAVSFCRSRVMLALATAAILTRIILEGGDPSENPVALNILRSVILSAFLIDSIGYYLWRYHNFVLINGRDSTAEEEDHHTE